MTKILKYLGDDMVGLSDFMISKTNEVNSYFLLAVNESNQGYCKFDAKNYTLLLGMLELMVANLKFQMIDTLESKSKEDILFTPTTKNKPKTSLQ